jgi:hypothetical protein
MSNKSIPNYSTGGVIPNYPEYSPNCPYNQQVFYIPHSDVAAYPGKPTCTKWNNQLDSPTVLKHQYSKKPFDYGPQRIVKPVGTLYDHDYSITHPTGLGRNKIIGGGHFKVYPLTNAHIRESRDYTDYYFQKPRSGIETVYDGRYVETQPPSFRTW